MAKIVIAFYNGVEDENNPNAVPIFYEGFIRGLDRAGNQLAVYTHKWFGVDFGEIDEETRNSIRAFDPDLCIIFNNSFYDLSEVVDCPIIVYEVDSPRYFSNRNNIRKNPDRYLYFIFQQDSRQVLRENYGVRDDHIYYVPFFSEVYADPTVEQTKNISFIGSLFLLGDEPVFESFMRQMPSDSEKKMMRNCLLELQKNPQATEKDLVYKYQITSELVARHLNGSKLVMMMSREKRVQILSMIADLGLALYGTENWENTYFGCSMLNLSYIRENVYSIAHNQNIYNQSKIGINVSHLQATSGFPWRVMDIMASNACLITDAHADFKRLFGDIPIPTYESNSEAYELCKRFLREENRRKEIVMQCQEVINSKYRFKHLLPKLEEYSGIVLHE